MLLLALNEAFDRRSIDILLVLSEQGWIEHITGDGFPAYAALAASGLIYVNEAREPGGWSSARICYRIRLTERGQLFVEGWKNGDQTAAIAALPVPEDSVEDNEPSAGDSAEIKTTPPYDE